MNAQARPTISVTASWDAEHKVWTATSEDVAGLFAQADTFEELADIVPSLISDLLALNGDILPETADVPLEILAHYQSSVHPHHR